MKQIKGKFSYGSDDLEKLLEKYIGIDEEDLIWAYYEGDGKTVKEIIEEVLSEY